MGSLALLRLEDAPCSPPNRRPMGRHFLALATGGRLAVIGLGTAWNADRLRWADDHTADAISAARWADRRIATIRDLEAALADSRAEGRLP